MLELLHMSHHNAGFFDFPKAPYRARDHAATKNTPKELSSSHHPKRLQESPQHLVPNWLLSDHSHQDMPSKHKQQKWEQDSDKQKLHHLTSSPSLPALLQLRDENPNFPITLPPPLPSPYQFVPLSSSSEYISPSSPGSSSSASAYPSPRLPDFFHPHSPVTRTSSQTHSHPFQHEPLKTQSFTSTMPSSPSKGEHHRSSAPPLSLTQHQQHILQGQLGPSPMELIQQDPFIHAIPPKSIPYFRSEPSGDYSLGSRRSELHHSYSGGGNGGGVDASARRTAFRPPNNKSSPHHSPSATYSPPMHHVPHDEPPLQPFSSFVPQEMYTHGDKFQSVPITPKASHPHPFLPNSPTLTIPSPQRPHRSSPTGIHSPHHPSLSLNTSSLSSPFPSPLMRSSSSSSVSQTANSNHPSNLNTSAPIPRKLYKHFEENEYNVRVQANSNNNNNNTTHVTTADHKPYAQRRPRTDKPDQPETGVKEKGEKFSSKRRRMSSELSVSEEPSDKTEAKPARHMRSSSNSNKVYCICEKPETKSAVKCVGCDKLFHLECSGTLEPTGHTCAECKKGKVRSAEDPKTSSPITKEVSEPTDDEEEENGIRIGTEVVSLSTIAKQPWLDGWATARNFAVQYLIEAKGFQGNAITEGRKLPKQIEVRNSSKGKRSWRQAEVLLAIQFLKTAELVDTSTKKGTTVREPYKTMDELIKKVQTVSMPSMNAHRRTYSGW